MPKEQTDYFKDFQELSSDEKKELIINRLIIKGYYPADAQLNLEAWQALTIQTKLLILKYIFSAPRFHVSGLKFLDQVAVVDLDTATRYSTRFFALFSLEAVIKEVFTSDNNELIGDFLCALASNPRFVDALPNRQDLKKMLPAPLMIFDSSTAAIEIAAKCPNVTFILMMLELRQDLEIVKETFALAILASIENIASNADKLSEIQKWLENNNKTEFEVRLLAEITKQQALHQEKPDQEVKGTEKSQPKKKRLTP